MHNYLVQISDGESSPERRYITVYASSPEQADDLAHRAATLMDEDFHKGRTFYVECVTFLG